MRAMHWATALTVGILMWVVIIGTILMMAGQL